MMSLASLASPQKRSSQSRHGSIEEPLSKRVCLESLSPKSVSSTHNNSGPIKVPTMFDDGPHKLLLRSIALVLRHIGFSSATPEAMGAFLNVVETYALHLLSKVTASMLCSRRSQPIPNDFQYALSEFDIPLLSIEPHLRPPVPAAKLLIELEQLPHKELPTLTNTALLKDGLDGDTDKNLKSYIPKKFPSFPSRHTYKWTEKDPEREIDPRKIREEAAKVARQGEEALRRLTKVAKAAKEKDAKKKANMDPRSKERHELWESVMESFISQGNSQHNSLTESNGENESMSMIVNAERQYFRKGTPGRRNSLNSTDPFKSLKLN